MRSIKRPESSLILYSPVKTTFRYKLAHKICKRRRQSDYSFVLNGMGTKMSYHSSARKENFRKAEANTASETEYRHLKELKHTLQ